MTPECSVCGYAVEWLRSCYSSLWRLSDDSTVFTPGRYVFAPPATPFFPGEHNLGSRNWTSDEREPEPQLGEVSGVRQTWHNGLTPNPYPAAVLLGGPDCLTTPATFDALCPWEYTAEGGAAWSFAGDTPSITFEDSTNCGGSNPDRQHGRATRDFICAIPRDVTFRLIGKVERQNVNFDKGRVLLDGQVVLYESGTGELLGCLMYDTFAEITLGVLPGRHTLEFFGDTVDGLYHVDAFFELTLEFDPPFPSDTRSFYQGYDLRCYVQQPPTPVAPPFVPDILSRTDAGNYAEVMAVLYDDVDAAAVLLSDILGPGTVVSKVANSGSLYPGTLIAVRGDFTVVVIAGTSNFFQLATQLCFAATGPADFGQYTTSAAWFLAKQAMHQRVLDAGADPLGRVQLVGHSYGGALATIMAADYLLFNPERQVDLLTFGAPKPGDTRLVLALRPARVARYANQGDFVPGLPPAYSQVLAYLPFLPGGLVGGWTQLGQPAGQLVLLSDGTISETDASTLSLTQLLLIIALLIAQVPLPLPLSHPIAEYVRRLRQTP